MATSARIDTYVGREVENATERRLLRRLLKHLELKGADAIIIANIIVGRDQRQIDFVVATATTAVAIEVKGYVYPVQGGLNGPWRLQIGGGGEKLLGRANPYHQALDCRYAISDAIAAHAGISSDDAKAAVKGSLCLFPSPIERSEIPASDFKLSIGGIAELEAVLATPLMKPIPLETWRSFAEALGARNNDEPLPVPEALLVDEYVSSFLNLRRASSGPYIEPAFPGPGVTTTTLAERLVDGAQLHIRGGSGSGKSELLNALAIEAGQAGFAPIVIQARTFTGELAVLLKKAVATATPLTPGALFQSLARSGREAILFIDGLNECPEAQLGDLLGALQAARLRFGFRVVTTSQTTPTLPSTLDGEAVQLHQPDRIHGQRLVEAHLGRSMSPAEVPGLEIVSTAHDCSVLAVVLQAKANADGRYALYAAFSRKRGEITPESTQQALAELAFGMRGDFVASLPLASTARFLLSRKADLSAVLDTGLAVGDDGLFRFRHDLIADFYAADHVLRSSTTPEDLAAAACRPLNADLREFILGGCATMASAEAVLEEVAATSGGQKLTLAGLRGRCGARVRGLLLDRCRDLLEKLAHRFGQVRLALPPGVETADQFHSFDMTFGADPGLTESEARLLMVLPQAMGEGLLPEMLKLFGDVDRRLEAEAERLRAEHPAFRLGWRAAAYGSVYGMSFSKEGREMNNILSAMQMITFDQQRLGVERELRHLLNDFENYTPGQLFLLVSAYRLAQSEAPPRRLNELAQHLWATRIYHLRLMAADIIRWHGRKTSPDVQSALRETLDSWLGDNAWMNSIVIDAYPGVGGLEPEFSIEDAVTEYEAILAHDVEEERNSLALGSVLRTWDHPFCEVYWEAFYNGLSTEQRQAVLLCAIDVVDGDAMFLSDVVRALNDVPTLAAVPRLREFAKRPWPHHHGYQSSVHLFANAVAGLAKLDVPLGDVGSSVLLDLERAWSCGAKLLFAFSCDHPIGDTEIARLWKELAACGPAAAIDVVMHLHREGTGFGTGGQTAFIERCPSGLLALSRRVLAADYIAQSIFQPFPHDSHTDNHRSFALQVLGTIGRRSDLPLLRTWLDHPKHGETALSAARDIESR